MKANKLSNLNIPSAFNGNRLKFQIHQELMQIETNRQKTMDEFNEAIAQYHQEKNDKEHAQILREEEQIELLEEIKNNTGSLVNMVGMIHSNSDQQTEIMLIIGEILAIGTAATPEEADSLYKKALEKINHTIESGENIAKLTTWATMAWTFIDKI